MKKVEETKDGQIGLIDSFLNTPRIFYGTKVSPDLKWVVWVWANVGEHADVYIAPLDNADGTSPLSISGDNIAPPDMVGDNIATGNDSLASNLPTEDIAPRKLTDFKQNTSIISWTADSRYIVVNHDYEGDERFRLYKIDVNSGEIFPLTPEHPNWFFRGGQITPDGKFLVYGANYDFGLKKETEPTILYKENLETGEKIKLGEPQKPSFLWPQLNKQGTHILYQKNDRHPQGEQVWLVDIDGKEDIEILNFGDKVKVLSASWNPNGEEIIFIVEAGTYRKVGIINLTTRLIDWMIDDASRNIEDAYMVYGSKDLIIKEIVGAQENITIFNRETLKETPSAEFQTIEPLAYISEGVSVSEYFNSKQPSDLIIHGRTSIIRSITKVFEKVDYSASDLAKAENYTWNSVDGLKIQGWLYKPTITTAQVGTIILVHGGPTCHSKDEWDMAIQYFVSEGFTVLDPNYRGSSGFGLPFQESIKVDGWGGKEQDDIVEGIKSLIKDGFAQEGKVGITGTSYGGYSAWFAITHYPKKYIAASIPICGMTDLVVDYETTRPDLRGYSEDMMGGTPTEVPERYKKGSPINYIENIQGKLLIVQGAKDPNVSPENVRAVEAALQKENIPYEKLIFEDEGHGISKPENQKTLMLKSVEFFKDAFGV